MAASILISPTPAPGSPPLDQKTLTICTSLRTGYQLISQTGKCNERLYESRTWYQMGSAPSGTLGSQLIALTTCISKSSALQIIRTRSACNSRTTTTALWQRPLGPSVAPSITSVAMGLLGTATLNIAAPAEDGGARVTSYLVTSSPAAIAATYTPAQIKAAKITGLTPGNTYTFNVVAINIKGASPSSIASAPALAPTIPSTPSITKVIATGTNSAQLSFSAPLDNGGSPITSYVATSNPGSLHKTVHQSGGGTIDVSNLSHSTTYTFTLTAHNAAGSSLASAISPSITTATPPPPEPVAPAPSPSPSSSAPALAAPAFTLSSSSETRTVETAATGFTINSTGGAIASFAISATPAGMSFSTSTGGLTGTPTTVAGATAYTITATNATGSTTQTFTLTVTAVVISVAAIAGVTAPVTGATPVTTTTAGTGYTGTVTWSGSPVTFASGTIYTATITLTPTSGYTLTGVSANFFSVTGATPVTNSANAGVITAVFPAAYVVGDTGPGGGLIYYVDNVTGFSCGATYITTGSPTGGLCHYLEVAPSGWNTGSDPLKFWAIVAYQSSDVIGITNDGSVYNNALGIGLGLKNSIAIVNQGNDTSTAAGAARAYAGGSKSDWYLPTTAELNLLCQWARNVTQVVTTACTGGVLNTGTGASGGFVADGYWSSSEDNAGNAWRQYFVNGSQFNVIKFNSFPLRPVRAF